MQVLDTGGRRISTIATPSWHLGAAQSWASTAKTDGSLLSFLPIYIRRVQVLFRERGQAATKEIAEEVIEGKAEAETSAALSSAVSIIDCKAETLTFDGASGAATPTCTTQTVDFMGVALREQGKDPSQLQLNLDAAASPSSCRGPFDG